ncbi:MAG: MoaD/ThiS family protein [Micavibrio sp.]
MKNVTVRMRLYGAFKKYDESVQLSVPLGSSITAVQEALCQALGPQARDLVMDSVIANDQAILPPDFIIDSDSSLSILPPVCGG